MKPPLHTECMCWLLCLLCKVQLPELHIKCAVWALKTNIPDCGQPHRHYHLCHSHTTPPAPVAGTHKAQLHARCQALSTHQLSVPPPPPPTPMLASLPSSLDARRARSTSITFPPPMPGSLSPSQLLPGFIHRGKEPGAALAYCFSGD